MLFPEGTRCLEDWKEFVENQVAPFQEGGDCASKDRCPWLRTIQVLRMATAWCQGTRGGDGAEVRNTRQPQASYTCSKGSDLPLPIAKWGEGEGCIIGKGPAFDTVLAGGKICRGGGVRDMGQEPILKSD